jgi:hypothetical protein
VEDLICDVADICVTVGWRMMPVHPSNIMPGKGVVITPEKCESILLTFLSNGLLYDIWHFIYTSNPENEKVDEDLGQWIITKTGYAGLDTHLAIIKMFRYLSERYFKSFELRDESSYWETNDVSACAAHFGITAEEVYQVLPLSSIDETESASVLMDILILGRGMGVSWN